MFGSRCIFRSWRVYISTFGGALRDSEKAFNDQQALQIRTGTLEHDRQYRDFHREQLHTR